MRWPSSIIMYFQCTFSNIIRMLWYKFEFIPLPVCPYPWWCNRTSWVARWICLIECAFVMFADGAAVPCTLSLHILVPISQTPRTNSTLSCKLFACVIRSLTYDSGTMIRNGPFNFLNSIKYEINPIVWIVLPKPISSARMPFRLLLYSDTNHSKPRIYKYLCTSVLCSYYIYLPDMVSIVLQWAK